MIKTNITIKKLRKLNKWIQSDKEAEKILKDIKEKPSLNLKDFKR